MGLSDNDSADQRKKGARSDDPYLPEFVNRGEMPADSSIVYTDENGKERINKSALHASIESAKTKYAEAQRLAEKYNIPLPPCPQIDDSAATPSELAALLANVHAVEKAANDVIAQAHLAAAGEAVEEIMEECIPCEEVSHAAPAPVMFKGKKGAMAAVSGMKDTLDGLMKKGLLSDMKDVPDGTHFNGEIVAGLAHSGKKPAKDIDISVLS